MKDHYACLFMISADVAFCSYTLSVLKTQLHIDK